MEIAVIIFERKQYLESCFDVILVFASHMPSDVSCVIARVTAEPAFVANEAFPGHFCLNTSNISFKPLLWKVNGLNTHLSLVFNSLNYNILMKLPIICYMMDHLNH